MTAPGGRWIKDMTVHTRLFNGSTFTFNNAAIGKVVGLQRKVNGQWIDVTEPDDTNKLFEVTPQAEYELTVKVKRNPTVTYAAKGTAAITWANGDNTALPGTWQIGPHDGGGDEDQQISGNITLRPTVPDS